MVEEPASEQLDIGGPVGTVRIQVFEMVTCAADWGGWHWFADGLDEDHARKHLRQRLESLDPFFGGPDYGRHGQPIASVDDLDSRIPASTRRKITGFLEAIEERERRELSP